MVPTPLLLRDQKQGWIADTHRKAAAFLPGAFALTVSIWLYQLRNVDFDAFFPLVGMVMTAAQTLGGALLIAACVVTATRALHVAPERVALHMCRAREL